jgi:ERO1-like protein alpha
MGLEQRIKQQPDLTCPQNDKEWCIEEKESDYKLNEADYIIVNLMDNIESFTAYEGAPIWSAIYSENCFLPLKGSLPQSLQPADQCTESTLLYHLMSGLHTSINTHVSANFYSQDSDLPYKNDTYFMERIGNHPDRVKNLHFIYSAAVRAVELITVAMQKQDYSTGISLKEDEKTPVLVRELLDGIHEHGRTFNEQTLFRGMTGRKTRLNLLT